MELVKENIEYEQLLGENFADTVVKSEFLIPDTHPDVAEILMIDVRPNIVNREVLQDKVYLEGQIEYNVLYLAKEEDKMGVHNVTYTDKFNNNVDLRGAEHKMNCEAECYMEHMDYSIINERKISLGGIVKLKSSVYKDYSFEVVKDVENAENIQMLKKPSEVDKIEGAVSGDLIVKSNMQVSLDRPQIGKILKYDILIHKKDVEITSGKVKASAHALIEILYRGKDVQDIVYLKDDVYISKELDMEAANPSMEAVIDFAVGPMELNVKEDDLGESRIVDVEALVTASVKAMYKQSIDMIEDVYSTQIMLNMVKKNFSLNVLQGQNCSESIVKENIEIDSSMPKPSSIVMTCGKAIITDKKLLEDKVSVEGILKLDVLYRTSDQEKYVWKLSEEIPFNSSADIAGSKIDMQCSAKVYLESLEASIEANTIGIKAIVTTCARVNYVTNRDFIVDVVPLETEVPKKKASLTIYVVQAGDTIWKIAKRYYSTIEELLKVNSIENADSLKVGQKLIIPGRAII